MAAQMNAQFTLTLKDNLSAGIKKLEQQLERLADLSRRLSNISNIGAKFNVGALTSDLMSAGNAMDGLRGKADAAERAIRRLGQARPAGGGFIPPALSRSVMAASIATAAALGGGGGRLPPPSSHASFFDGPQLRLEGAAGGGGIPLQFSPALMQIGALRAGLAGAAGQARQLNHHLREAGHGALGALTTGFGLFEPVREYAAYENTARHIAITENVPREQLPAMIKQLTGIYDKLALSTGQSAEKVAESANFLITTGIGGEAVNKMLPIIAKAATAYNTNIGDSVQAVFALKENLHVPDAQLGTAVSSGALAAKEGHFSFQDMSRYLPAVAPIAAMSGLKGLGGAQELMASLETSRRNSGTSEEAFTNYRDYLSHLFGDPKRGLAHSFQKNYGVNLSKVLLEAEKQGISAPEAVVAQVKQLVKGKTAYETNLIIGRLFTNQQSAGYLRGRLADDKYFNNTRDKLNGTDPDTIQHDFLKAFDAPQIQLNRLQEALKQIVRRFGEGFAGLVPPITMALEAAIALFDRIDAMSPGTVNKVLGVAGGFLAMMAVFGILLPVFRAIGVGFGLIGTVVRLLVGSIALLSRGFIALQVAGGPILWIVEAIALAGLLLYYNWDKIGPRFELLVSDLKDSFGQLGNYLRGLGAKWLRPFDEFLDGMREKIEAVRKMLGGGTTQGPQRLGDGRRDLDNSVDPDGKPSLGGIPGFRDELKSNPFGAMPMSYRQSGGGGQVTFAPLELKITLDGTGQVQPMRRSIPLDRGDMLGRI